MPAQAYLIARRRSAARLLQATADSSAWHQTVKETPGLVVTGGTAVQLTVQATEPAIEQLRQALGEGFLIEPVLTRDTTADGEPSPAAGP